MKPIKFMAALATLAVALLAPAAAAAEVYNPLALAVAIAAAQSAVVSPSTPAPRQADLDEGSPSPPSPLVKLEQGSPSPPAPLPGGEGGSVRVCDERGCRLVPVPDLAPASSLQAPASTEGPQQSVVARRFVLRPAADRPRPDPDREHWWPRYPEKRDRLARRMLAWPRKACVLAGVWMQERAKIRRERRGR